MKTINKDIGDRISKWRRGAGLKQSEVAKKLNLSRASIANIEGGRQAVTVETLISISKLSGISVTAFIGDTGKDLKKEDKLKLPYKLHRELDKIPKPHLTALLNLYRSVR